MPDARGYLDLISSGAGGSSLLESAQDPANNRDPAIRREMVDRVEAEIAYLERLSGLTADPAERAELVKNTDEALAKLLGEGPDAVLTDQDVLGFEAVVISNGSRPVLFVQNDFVDPTDPSIGNYLGSLSRQESAVRDVCRAVGRVEDPASRIGYRGTAWAIAEGIVVTNFHVLAGIAPYGTRRNGRFEGRLNPGVAVHFGHEVCDRRPERRFPVRRVIGVGREAVAAVDADTGLAFDGLDLAVLELEPVPNRPFPEPVRVARGDDPATLGGLASQGRGIYVVGFPGNEASTTPDIFLKLFAGVKSVKRLAPGMLTTAPGDLSGDERGWIVTHDASTLGGNSGSVIADLDADAGTALALHFATDLRRRSNYAHALERITTELDAAVGRAVR
jgi:hypothetical protein